MSDFARKLRSMYEKVVKVKGGCNGGGVTGGARKRKVGAKKVVKRVVKKVGMKKAAKKNPWIAHVKKYAASHGLTYGEALKKARASYRG